MHNQLIVDKLKVNWDDSICSLIFRKFRWKSYHNDINSPYDTKYNISCTIEGGVKNIDSYRESLKIVCLEKLVFWGSFSVHQQ